MLLFLILLVCGHRTLNGRQLGLLDTKLTTAAVEGRPRSHPLTPLKTDNKTEDYHGHPLSQGTPVLMITSLVYTNVWLAMPFQGQVHRAPKNDGSETSWTPVVRVLHIAPR